MQSEERDLGIDGFVHVTRWGRLGCEGKEERKLYVSGFGTSDVSRPSGGWFSPPPPAPPSPSFSIARSIILHDMRWRP